MLSLLSWRMELSWNEELREPGEGVALKWPLDAATERGEVGAL